MHEYDEIGEVYGEQIRLRPERVYVYVPTFRIYLGDVRGLDVLDLACGDGFMTEIIAGMKPNRLVGVDISPGQIDRARRSAHFGELDIEYVVADAAALPDLGVFDVATAAFLLHYAKTQEELQAMCREIALSLKPGGRFVALNNNPRCPIVEQMQYRVTIRPVGELYEGAPLRVTFYNDVGGEICSFTNYYWTEETYEAALRNVGFTDIQWHPLQVAELGMIRFPQGYWDQYLADSSPTILTCNF